MQVEACEEEPFITPDQLIDHYHSHHDDILKFRYECILTMRCEAWPRVVPWGYGPGEVFGGSGEHRTAMRRAALSYGEDPAEQLQAAEEGRGSHPVHALGAGFHGDFQGGFGGTSDEEEGRGGEEEE